MSLILSLETATTVCGVALHQAGQLLASATLCQSQSHSVQLNQMVEDVLQRSGHHLSHLSGVAVSMGPGSYTGLRIGVATAKGLCYAGDLPLLAVNTLAAMTWGLCRTNPQPLWYCPMLDARRMEVYCAIYDEKLQEIEPTQAKIIDEQAFIEHLADHNILFFGDGAAKCKPLLSNQPRAFFVEDVVPSVEAVGQLAYKRFTQQQFEDVAYFEPFYLKDFISTSWLAQQPKK